MLPATWFQNVRDMCRDMLSTMSAEFGSEHYLLYAQRTVPGKTNIKTDPDCDIILEKPQYIIDLLQNGSIRRLFQRKVQ